MLFPTILLFEVPCPQPLVTPTPPPPSTPEFQLCTGKRTLLHVCSCGFVCVVARKET